MVYRVKLTCWIFVDAETEDEARKKVKKMSDTDILNSVDCFGEKILEVE